MNSKLKLFLSCMPFLLSFTPALVHAEWGPGYKQACSQNGGTMREWPPNALNPNGGSACYCGDSAFLAGGGTTCEGDKVRNKEQEERERKEQLAQAAEVARKSPPQNADRGLVYCDVVGTGMVYWNKARCGEMAGFVQVSKMDGEKKLDNKPVDVKALAYELHNGSSVERVSISVADIRKDLGIKISTLADLEILQNPATREKLRNYSKKALGKSEGEIYFVGIGSPEVHLRGGYFSSSTVLTQPLRDFDCYYNDGLNGTTVGDHTFIIAPTVQCVKDGKKLKMQTAFCVVPKNQKEPFARDCVTQDEKSSPNLYLSPKLDGPATCKAAYTVAHLSECFQVVVQGEKKDIPKENKGVQ